MKSSAAKALTNACAKMPVGSVPRTSPRVGPDMATAGEEANPPHAVAVVDNHTWLEIRLELLLAEGNPKEER